MTAEQTATLPPAVAEIGKIHFEGNIIPHQWYQQITLESGKPDLPAIIILAEIIYWYRPYQTLTKGGKPILKKHFDGDMFQCSAAYDEKKFVFTKTQARRAISRLHDMGLTKREFRSVMTQGIMRNNVMFVEPIPSAIMAITHPDIVPEVALVEVDPSWPVSETLSPVSETLSPVSETLSPVSEIYEITTETTTEITTTTPNPSASTESAATTEPACCGRGDEDQNTQDQGGDQELAALEVTEQNSVDRQEVQAAATTEESSEAASESQNPLASRAGLEEEQPELAFPAKLTEAEYDDIAAQVYALPPEIAQQMLDVVAAKMKAGQIKTNPAAILRGITRKYRADPTSFDPSIGFAVADARRRRLEEQARAEAEAEQRAQEREALRVSPQARESAHRSLAAIKQLLRGHA